MIATNPSTVPVESEAQAFDKELITAKRDAIAVLRDLMFLQPEDPRPKHHLTHMRLAATVILRIKPLSHEVGEDRLAAGGSGEGGLPRSSSKRSKRTEEPYESQIPNVFDGLDSEELYALLASIPGGSTKAKNPADQPAIDKFVLGGAIRIKEEKKRKAEEARLAEQSRLAAESQLNESPQAP